MTLCTYRPKRLSLALIAGVLNLLLVAASVPAWGHALLMESSPPDGTNVAQAPQKLILRFNVKIEKALTRVTITGPDSRTTPLAIATQPPGAEAREDTLVISLPPLRRGSYRVRYRVLAADGHATEGALRFSVGGQVVFP